MKKEEIVEEIKGLLDKSQQDDRILMGEFFNLLFWRDYKDGYVGCEDRQNIITEIRKHTRRNGYNGDEYVSLDTNKILPFVNKIRKKINLPELDNTLYSGTLLEVTPEVRKELILKELK